MVICGITCCALTKRPNVLLITIDTLRADRLGSYGYTLAKTHNIDRLAAEGVLYKNAVASAPITLPSHATILTGLYPPAHGVRDNGAYALGNDAVTLAERLKEQGYTTQAFVSASVLSRHYNLSQGFDGYDDNLWSEDDPEMFMIRYRPAKRTVGQMLKWLETWHKEKKHKPFFAWVHLFDPHQPYHPPFWARMLSPTPYDAEISYVDHNLGLLFQMLKEYGLLDNTLIIFTADHGESLGEHNEKTHAIFIYEATVRVPLIIRYPKLFPKGKIYEAPVRNVDIVPTVLAILNIPGANETQGIDLLPVTLGKTPPPDLPQYSESLLSEVGFGMAPLYGVRKNNIKWIRAPKPELYDIINDPNELHNLYAEQPELAQSLDAELETILAESKTFSIDATENPMTGEAMEMLQALGYLAGGQERQSMSGMDPKDGILIYNKLETARHLARDEKWAESETLLQEILKELPKHISARNVLALTLIKQNRMDEAKKQYLRSLEDDPKQYRVYSMLAGIAVRENDLDTAEKYLHEALNITPDFVGAISDLGLIEILRGNEKKAQEWYDKAIAIDPAYPHVYRRVADVYYQRKDFQQALKYYLMVLDRTKTDFRALIQAGNCANRIGNKNQAIDFFNNAMELRPDSPIPNYNLACVWSVKKDAGQAISHLNQAIEKGFKSINIITHDTDMAFVRTLPEYPNILDRIRQQAAKTSE